MAEKDSEIMTRYDVYNGEQAISFDNMAMARAKAIALFELTGKGVVILSVSDGESHVESIFSGSEKEFSNLLWRGIGNCL